METIEKRCKSKKCWSYVYCTEDDMCYDGLDIRSTLMRNINDAHGSSYKNNCYFDEIKGQVYIIAAKNIKPHKELFISYGRQYWGNK